jgi:hypothetical protein
MRPTPSPCLAILLVAIPAALAGGCAGSGALHGAGMDVPGCLRRPPFVWCSREPDGSREARNFLGFLYRQVAQRSPTDRPPAPGDILSRDSLDVLWPVYHTASVVRADGRRSVTRRFLPFVSTRRQSEKSGAGADYTQLRVNVLGIVLSLRSDNYGRGMTEADFLWPLGHYFSGERDSRDGGRELAQTFRFLPFVSAERTWRLADEGLEIGLSGRTGPREADPSRGRRADRVRLRVLHSLFGYERDAEARTKRAFLLGGAYADAADQRHAWGLVSWEGGPATDSDFGLLWQLLFVARRWGSAGLASAETGERPSDLWRATKWLFRGSPGKLVKFTPFFNYESDWAADRKKVSILLGLWSYERDGADRRGRFLWFIPWGGRRRRRAPGEYAARPPGWPISPTRSDRGGGP